MTLFPIADYWWLYGGFTLFVLLLLFAIRNTTPVRLRFFFDQGWDVPLILLLLLFFVIGVTLGVLASLERIFRQDLTKEAIKKIQHRHERADDAENLGVDVDDEARFGDVLAAPVHQRHDETEIRIAPASVPDVLRALRRLSLVWMAELVDAEIAATKALATRNFGVNLITMHPQLDDLIKVCLEAKVGHIVLAGGLPPGSAIKAVKDGDGKPLLELLDNLSRLGPDGQARHQRLP